MRQRLNLNLNKKFLVGLIFIYLASLIALFPARLVSIGVPSEVILSGVRGTLWNGKIDYIDVQGLHLEQVSWQIHAWSFFALALDVDLSLGNQQSLHEGQLSLTLSPYQQSLKNVKLRLDMASLVAFLGDQIPANLVKYIHGDISLAVKKYTYAPPFCSELQGYIDAQDIDLENQFGYYPLGDFSIDAQCDSGAVQLELEEEGNQLGISASLLLKPSHQFTLIGTIKPVPNMHKDMKYLLSFLGQPDSNGKFPIEFEGTLPK